MKILAAAILALFLAPAAFAGGGDFNDQQQQMAPQTKVIVVQPDTGGGDSDWVIPAIIAAIGAAGVVGAAYVSKRKG